MKDDKSYKDKASEQIADRVAKDGTMRQLPSGDVQIECDIPLDVLMAWLDAADEQIESKKDTTGNHGETA